MHAGRLMKCAALAALLALLAVLLPVVAGDALAATWTRVADQGITNAGNRFIMPGARYQGQLMLASEGNQGLAAYMYAYDGSSFSEITNNGFGVPTMDSIFPNVEFEGDLFLGTADSNLGARLMGWDGAAAPWPVTQSMNGWGEGPDSYVVEPMGVLNGKILVSVWNGSTPTIGFRIYEYDGTDWTEIAGPSSPVEGRGLGNPNNYGIKRYSDNVLDGVMYFATVNDNEGTEVWAYDGAAFSRIGGPGGSLWSAAFTEGAIAVSHPEETVYLGATNLGLNPPELWAYQGGDWSDVPLAGVDVSQSDRIQPLVRGEDLYLSVDSVLNGCRIYKRTSGGFSPISDYGFDGANNNSEAGITTYNGKMVASTWNFNGAEVWTTPIGPTIDRLEPDHGPYGTPVRIHGHDFLGERGSGTVTFDGVEATEILFWSDQLIEVLLPPGAGTGPVQVLQANGDSNEVDFTLSLSSTYYFAEGTTRNNATDGVFEEWLCLQNPQGVEADVTLTYMLGDGSTEVQNLTVSKESRSTVSVNEFLGADKDVSTLVQSDQLILAERPMYFNYHNKWTGGHIVMGLPEPRDTFYFAEGTTRDNSIDGTYEEWLCVQNPNDQDAKVTVTYMLGTGENIEKEYDVGKTSRTTIDVNTDVGANQDVSMLVESTAPVVAERPMYFNYHEKWTGGHDVVGAPEPDTVFYFAEGTTRNNVADGSYEEWICIQNPTDNDAQVTITYYTDQAGVKQESLTVPGKSRSTVYPLLLLGYDVDNSCKVESTNGVPILVERPMYFTYQNVWPGGHDVMGCSSPRNTWYFAEGTTLGGFVTYVSVMNPGDATANLTFTYMLGDETTRTATATVEPNKRFTRNVAADVGDNQDVSIRIDSDRPVVAERMMYFGYHNWCPGGHDTLGYGI